MKKSLKTLFVLISVSMGVGFLSSCKPAAKDPVEHTHVYDGYEVDGNYHYQVCTICGEESERATHHGGHSTCQEKAHCEVCGAEYGLLDEHDYTDAEWKYDDNDPEYHYRECNVCHEKDKEKHTFTQEVIQDEYLVNEKTSVCGESNTYYLSCHCGAHSLSSEETFTILNSHDFSLEEILPNDENLVSAATCTEKAVYGLVCSHCHEEFDPTNTFTYGEAKGHNLTKYNELKTFATYHKEYYYCDQCSLFFIDDSEEGAIEPNLVEETYDNIFISDNNQYIDSSYGSEENPYVLAFPEDFYYLRDVMKKDTNTFEGYYFVVNNDIDFNLGDDTKFGHPIGFSDTLPFSGTFDGQNHTLSNISITGNDSIALFSRATNATIKNLKIENIQVTITGSQRAAALVARADNVTLENIEIVSGSIGTSTSKIAKQAGGIVAFALNGLTMTNCINRADVYSAGAANGGMLGAVHTTAITVTLSNCVNYGNITGGSDGTGGIVGGVNTKSATYNISSCINYGAITGAGNGTGGILGATGGGNVSVTKISNCDNYGDVTGTAYVGGIGGILREGDKTNSLITNCYNAGNIAGTGVGVGGITGISRIDTTDCMCLHTATVKGSVASGLNAIGTTVSGNGGAGSVAGYISGSAGNGATVTGKLVDSNKDEYIPS